MSNEQLGYLIVTKNKNNYKETFVMYRCTFTFINLAIRMSNEHFGYHFFKVDIKGTKKRQFFSFLTERSHFTQETHRMIN